MDFEEVSGCPRWEEGTPAWVLDLLRWVPSSGYDRHTSEEPPRDYCCFEVRGEDSQEGLNGFIGGSGAALESCSMPSCLALCLQSLPCRTDILCMG